MPQTESSAPPRETASAETQELIDLCLAVAEGDPTQLETLRARTAQRRQDLDRAVDTFFGPLEEDFRQQFQAEIEEVGARFRAYEAVLEKIETLREDGGEDQTLADCAAALGEASRGLREAHRCYEERTLSTGPSKFPLINLFDNLARALREGKVPPAQWEATCSHYLGFYRKALEEIDRSEHREAPGVPERRAAVTRILELIDGLGALTGGDAADKFLALLGELTAAHLDLEKAFHTYHLSVFTQGPTSAPAVNLVLNAAAGFREGKYETGTFKAVVEEHLGSVRNGLEQIQAVLNAPDESAVLAQEMARMLEALEGMEDALLVLLEVADKPPGDGEQFQDALALLEACGEKLAQATLAANEYNRSAGKVVCVHCQAENPAGTRVCSGCERPLPPLDLGSLSSFQVLEGGGAPDFSQETVVTDVMKALFEECDALMRGELELHALLEKLQIREAGIRAAEERLGALRAPEVPPEASGEDQIAAQNFADLAEDALDLLHLGLEECREGLEKMREAAQQRDPELMQEGKEFYFRGTQRLWQVSRLDDALQNYLQGT